MPEQILRIAAPFLLFFLAVYGVGLRPSGRLPFLKLEAPARFFSWVVHAAAKSRLRKTKTIRDWFVYREGQAPGTKDLARVQKEFIASFCVLLVVSLIAS